MRTLFVNATETIRRDILHGAAVIWSTGRRSGREYLIQIVPLSRTKLTFTDTETVSVNRPPLSSVRLFDCRTCQQQASSGGLVLRQHHVSGHQRFVPSATQIASLACALIAAQGISSSSARAMDLDAGGLSDMGIASFYRAAGKLTASGERMNPAAFTAAHRSLPFGTRITVTNLYNARSVVVRINDRGPFVRGRVIDLSPAAALAIGIKGLALVSLSLGDDQNHRAIILPDAASKSDCGGGDCYATTLTPGLQQILARASAVSGASLYVSTVVDH